MAKLSGKDIYQAVLKYGSLREAASKLKTDRTNARRSLKLYCNKEGIAMPQEDNTAPIKTEFPNKAQLSLGGIQRYIVTSMHNDTPLNSACFESLRKAAEHMGAQFCVIPLLYKNPNLFTAGNRDVSWPAEALPYTVYGNIIINDEWMIAGKLHCQATAARPLQGMQGFSKERSAVIGHARIAWETRPTPPGKPPIRQITTGSISVPQYSDTKLGQLADFHHTQGALLIETDGNRTFVRHLRPSTSTGEFFDFEHHYTADGYQGTKDLVISAVVFGDLHERFSDEKDLIQQFTKEYLPNQVFIHDAIDSFSISHHHEKNPLIRMAKKTLNMDKLDLEVANLCKFHDRLPKVCQIVYVSSNHTEDHIMGWLKARNWQQIDGNSKIHRYVLNAYMDYLEDKDNAERYVTTGFLPAALELLMRREGAALKNARFPSINDSIMVHSIECGQHGHRGPNGAKGTPSGFRQSQYKIIVGHIHSPGIYDGVYVVGTSSRLKMNYNDGLSGWDNVHATIDCLGKRRLFNTVQGKYRLEI